MRNSTHTVRSSHYDRLVYSAKVDYVTVQTPGKRPLPRLDGIAKWPREYHGMRLTVHDATPADLLALQVVYGPLAILELEVAVDIRLPRSARESKADKVLEDVMVNQIAKNLDPSGGAGMVGKSRAIYRRLGSWYVLRPFNRVLPIASDQQLHGWRGEGVQVKCYLKKLDQGAELDHWKHVARMEVRLSGDGLTMHGLSTIADLEGFKFRKRLTPYFRHVKEVAHSRHTKSRETPMLKLLRTKSTELKQDAFEDLGVGPFLPGGNYENSSVRFTRNTEINGRIGQALSRMELGFRRTKFVCFDMSPV